MKRMCRIVLALIPAITSQWMAPHAADAQCFGPYDLIAPDAAMNDLAGSAVAISGSWAIVGAPMDDGGRADEGSASIYRFDGAQWIFEARLAPPNGARLQQFGATVDLSGDTAVVGYGAFGGLFPAYVFTRNTKTGIWSLQAQVFAEPAVSLEQFSASVAIDGDTLAVGAPLHTGGAGTSQGAVYIFTRTAGTWSQQMKLLPSDAAAFAEFGASVAISGDTVVAGAPGDVRRAAYVFTRAGSTWTQQAKLVAGKVPGNIDFGRRVAIDGDSVLVGAPLYDGPAGADQGAVFAFGRIGAKWPSQGLLRPSDAQAGARFGTSLDLSGDEAVVGRSIADEAQAGAARGGAWIFERSGAAWSEVVRLEDLRATSWDRFGRAVAIEGEMALVGAPLALNGPVKNPIRTGDATSYRKHSGQWVRRMPGDADLDGQVVFLDISAVLAYWGADYRPGTGPGDCNGDGVVNNLDIAAVTGNWRTNCP